MRILEKAHPLCSFMYLLAVLGITIFTRHPIMLAASAVGAALLLILSEKGRLAAWMPLIVVASAVTNPIFSHNGATVLFFAGDMPITLEAILYGADFGLMLAASVGWSFAAVKYITSDKYIWLFGRILPSAGLVLSCALRLVPLFIRRGRDFAAAQQADTIRGSLKAFSASVGYSAEEAMTSADSMRARGYGTARRTSYSLYRFGGRECMQLSVVILLGGCSAALMLAGAGDFGFYPEISVLACDAQNLCLYVVFAALAMLPCSVVVYENVRRMRGFAVAKGALK